ncbi:MAG: GNAT family N-acetyltransferase [Halobacteriota archaeon]
MDVRNATPEDATAIKSVARKSLLGSYTGALDDDTIEEAVEEWYGGDRLQDLLERETEHFLVAESDDAIVGFAELTVSDATDVGAIQWLHVDPEYRGEGVGSALLEAAEMDLLDRGVARVEGAVLAANVDGINFYEDHGYVRGADQETSIAGDTFTERRYLRFPEGEPAALMEAKQTDEGTYYVALDEHEIGSRGDFYVAYTDVGRTERYGYYCDNCDSINTSMDSMGRIICNDCGNKHKASRWDAAWL